MNYIGIDLGGTNIAVGLVNERGEILSKTSTPTLARRDTSEIMDDMASCVFEVLKKANVKIEEVDFCGIAAPGLCNTDTGVVERSENLPMDSYPIAHELKKRIGIDNIKIENDANAAAKGEAEVGAAKGYRSSVMITLGTGVGGGVILDGKVYSGFNFAGAELGHMVIVKDGVQCNCGRRGCLEQYASATALGRLTREKMEKCPDSIMWDICMKNINHANGRTAFDAMRRGDRAGAEVVDEYIGYLACGVTNLINIFQPEVLSIGGGISNERDYLLLPLREKVEKENYAYNTGVPQTKICIAQLRNDAGIIGAAMLGVNG